MLICHKPKFIAVLPTKTGTRSLHYLLRRLFPIHKLKPHHEIAPEYPKYREYFTLCTIRNPYSRLVSQYWHTCDPARIPPGADAARKALTRAANEVGFEAYIRMWDPQPIAELTADVRLDYLIRLESYVADVRRLPLPGLDKAKIPHEHNSRRSDWREHYAGREDLIRWVQERYAADFQAFGYNPEFPGETLPGRR